MIDDKRPCLFLRSSKVVLVAGIKTSIFEKSSCPDTKVTEKSGDVPLKKPIKNYDFFTFQTQTAG